MDCGAVVSAAQLQAFEEEREAIKRGYEARIAELAEGAV